MKYVWEEWRKIANEVQPNVIDEADKQGWHPFDMVKEVYGVYEKSSDKILIRELFAAYQGLSEERKSELLIQYADYPRWHREQQVRATTHAALASQRK